MAAPALLLLLLLAALLTLPAAPRLTPLLTLVSLFLSNSSPMAR